MCKGSNPWASSLACRMDARSKPEIDSWFDRSFLNAALRAQKLEGYWPEYAADGNLVGSSVAAAR